MNTADTNATGCLRQEVINELESLRFHGSAKDIDARMLRDFDRFGAVEYSYYLSEEFEQSLIHVPNAFDYLLRLSPRSDLVSEAVIGFVKTWQNELRKRHLLESTVGAVSEVLLRWSGSWPCEVAKTTSDWDALESSLLIAPPALDILMDALVESKIPAGPDELFAQVFAKWVKSSRQPKASACVLDFFLRVRLTSSDLKLYRDARVLSCAFDTKLVSSHWETARSLVTAKKELHSFAGLVRRTLLKV
jgi:hypothetical protein